MIQVAQNDYHGNRDRQFRRCRLQVAGKQVRREKKRMTVRIRIRVKDRVERQNNDNDDDDVDVEVDDKI